MYRRRSVQPVKPPSPGGLTMLATTQVLLSRLSRREPAPAMPAPVLPGAGEASGSLGTARAMAAAALLAVAALAAGTGWTTGQACEPPQAVGERVPPVRGGQREQPAAC